MDCDKPDEIYVGHSPCGPICLHKKQACLPLVAKPCSRKWGQLYPLIWENVYIVMCYVILVWPHKNIVLPQKFTNKISIEKFNNYFDAQLLNCSRKSVDRVFD